MGTIRFYCPPDRMTREWTDTGYAYGFDLMPWQTRMDYVPGLITARVDGNESLRFCCPWYVKGMGLITLSTGSLLQRNRPYCLPLEMARSKIGSVRGQIYDWSQAGLPIPEIVVEHTRVATQCLGRAVRIMSELNARLGLDSDFDSPLGFSSVVLGLFGSPNPGDGGESVARPLSPDGVPMSFTCPPEKSLELNEEDSESGKPESGKPELVKPESGGSETSNPETGESGSTETGGLVSPFVVYADKFSALFQESVRALQYALQAANTLVQTYSQRRLAVALSNKTLAATGCSMGEIVPSEAFTKIFVQLFQFGRIEINWRKFDQSPAYKQLCVQQAHWCRKNKVRCAIGPLLRFDYNFLPEWLELYSDDWESVCEYVRSYVSECIDLFGPDIDIWYAVSKVNVNGVRGWNEEKRVQLAAVVLDELQRRAVSGEVGLCLSQPYDESMGRSNGCFTAGYYANVLLTSGFKLDFLELEINIGFLGDGSHDRDPLQFSKTLDTWLASGVPLSVSLCVPGASFPHKEKSNVSPPYFNNWSSELQTACVKRCLTMFSVKPHMKSVVWNTLVDPLDGGLLGTGLFDSAGHPKSVLQPFIQLYKWRNTLLVNPNLAEKTPRQGSGT